MNQRIKYLSLFFAALLLCSAILFAGAVIVDFRGESGQNKVTLYWSTLSETNCRGFQIERGLNKTDFKKIGFVNGAGSSSVRKDYKYIDKSVYKPGTNRTFHYRLKVINSDNSESVYSQIVSVIPAISGARYTWGSIKAIFR